MSPGLGHGKASGMTELHDVVMMMMLHVNFTQMRHDLYDRRNVKNRLGNIIAIVGSMWPLGSEFEPALQRGRKDRALAPGPLSDGGNKIAPKKLGYSRGIPRPRCFY